MALQESENRNDKRLKDLEGKKANLIKTYDELFETNKYLQEQNDVYVRKNQKIIKKTIENSRKQLTDEYKSKSLGISKKKYKIGRFI